MLDSCSTSPDPLSLLLIHPTFAFRLHFRGRKGGLPHTSRSSSHGKFRESQRDKPALPATLIAVVSDHLSPVVDAQDLGVYTVERVHLDKTLWIERHLADEPMSVSRVVEEGAHDLGCVHPRSLCHRLRNSVQRDVEDGKAVLADREHTQKAVAC